MLMAEEYVGWITTCSYRMKSSGACMTRTIWDRWLGKLLGLIPPIASQVVIYCVCRHMGARAAINHICKQFGNTRVLRSLELRS